MNFNGRVVVITGSGGIGFAVAKKFSDLGCNVALLDVIMDQVNSAIEKLNIDESRILGVQCDVRKEEDVKRSVRAVLDKFYTIDFLISTAGIPGPSAKVEDYSYENAKRVFDINILGTFLMVSNCIKPMKEKGFGSIVTFGSCSGMCGYPYESAYGVSKAAMIQLARNVANENGSNGIRVNSISPGWVDTNMMKMVTESYVDVGISNPDDNITLGPMGRPANASEIADICAFLCSEEASYINGANIVADGGMTLG